jgi:hypothetical protein
MTNDTNDHDCPGCAIRAKLHDALAGVDPATPLEPIVNAVLRELTVVELWQLAGATLEEWAEDERRPTRRSRLTRLASAGHGVRP